MKPSVLTLSFLLFAITAKLQLAFSQDVEQVVDTSGKPIFPGGQYYIMPSPIWGPPGGGVKLGKTGGSTCPVTVLQDRSEVNFGLPVTFSIPGVSPGIIFTGTPLDIEFSKKPNCAESSKWVIIVDNDLKKAYVGIGGPENHPGNQIASGKFHIDRKYNQTSKPLIVTYKLVFCVSGSPTCLDVGRYDNRENGRRLILTADEPFGIGFVNASPDESGLRSVV